MAGPFSGDAACTPGHHGPLCAVCDDDFFKFSGKCLACESNGQAKAMLAVTVTLFSVMVVLIFARSWEFGTGPGILTKIKIFTAHLQASQFALARRCAKVMASPSHLPVDQR
jgi:hypothetical protein